MQYNQKVQYTSRKKMCWMEKQVLTIQGCRKCSTRKQHHFQVLNFHVLRFGPSFLCPAFSVIPTMTELVQQFSALLILTPSTPAVLNCCCSKGSVPYWSNPPFLISDIWALWHSGVSARVPECQKLKM